MSGNESPAEEKVVVKVQLPIATTESTPHMLVYSEDRETIFADTPVQERFAKELRAYPHKGYYAATLRDGVIDIGERVADQEW